MKYILITLIMLCSSSFVLSTPANYYRIIFEAINSARNTSETFDQVFGPHENLQDARTAAIKIASDINCDYVIFHVAEENRNYMYRREYGKLHWQ